MIAGWASAATVPRMRFGHVRMEHGEGADLQLVDQAAGLKQRRLAGDRLRQARDDRLRHQRRGVAALAAPRRQPGVVDDRAGRSRPHRDRPAACRDRTRGRAPAHSRRRRESRSARRPSGPARSARMTPSPSRCKLEPVGLAVSRVVEQARPRCALAVPDQTAKRMPSSATVRAKSRSASGRRLCCHQVMTVGLLRPVWLRMPAMSSAAAIRSASASCVSRSWRVGSGS